MDFRGNFWLFRRFFERRCATVADFQASITLRMRTAMDRGIRTVHISLLAQRVGKEKDQFPMLIKDFFR
jgi:hypothetical protein